MTASLDRAVDPFDVTILWPIRIAGKSAGSVRTVLRRVLGDSQWKRITDLVRRGGSDENDGYAFAELVYFHLYIQAFLYSTRDKINDHPFDLYQLSPSVVTTFEVKKPWTQTFDVAGVWLYVMENDTAMLVVCMSSASATTLARALDTISYIRTTYFQHYELCTEEKGGPTQWRGAGAVEDARFVPLQSTGMPENGAADLAECLDKLEPSILPHWRALLSDLITNGVKVLPLGDHRAAVMALLGTADPFTISDDEWFALSQADSSQFPIYSPAFREKELPNVVYDRWWSSSDPSYSHRYVIGPMTYCTVFRASRSATSRGNSYEPKWVDQFRKRWTGQHFQMFLLAHFQRASLLIIQERIAKAARRLDPEESTEIQKDIAVFSGRYWFTEISPQIQPQELYVVVRRQLRLDALYRSVIDDKGLLADWVSSQEEKQRMRFWDLVNKRAIPAGLLATTLGINVFFEPLKHGLIRTFGDHLKTHTYFREFLVDAILFMFFAICVFAGWAHFRKRIEQDKHLDLL